MLDALSADQRIRNFSHRAGLAAHHQYFKAIVVIEMHMQRGEDRAVVIVLQVGQLLVEEANVVIVYEGDSADNTRFGRFPGLFHQLIPDKIAKGLRPVRIATVIDEPIEFLEKLGIDGYANAAQFAHS